MVTGDLAFHGFLLNAHSRRGIVRLKLTVPTSHVTVHTPALWPSASAGQAICVPPGREQMLMRRTTFIVAILGGFVLLVLAAVTPLSGPAIESVGR